MARSLDRERLAIASKECGRPGGWLPEPNSAQGRRFGTRMCRRPEPFGGGSQPPGQLPRAISAAQAASALPAEKPISRRKTRKTRGYSPSYGTFPPRLLSRVCGTAAHLAFRVCGGPAPPLRVTVIAAAVFLAIVIAASAAGSEIDLTRFLPGASAADGRPRIVVVEGRLVNQGEGPALNLEVTRPRYRLIGNLNAGAGQPIPGPDFSVQYEWREGDRVHRETRTFKTSQPSAPASTGRTAPLIPAPIDSATLPPGLTATYDHATHLLTVSAARPVEVRVDGFLLRPVSRTDKEGAQYRYAQANILVLGQDLKRGETVTFEVVFTRPQDYYSIPIYVREPDRPPAYLTVSTALAGEAAS